MNWMSKELEALRTIGNIRVKETYSDEPSKVSDLKTLFKNQYLIIEQALKRNVPLKVNHKENKGVTTVGTCGNCGGLVSEVNDDYCSLCGQKLDWSDSE